MIGELESLVRDHPLRETFRRQLMLALYRAGRQAEALEVYQDARARFVDELGIEPGPELKRLQAEILRHEAGLAASDAPAAADEEGEIVKALLAGRVVPVIGLDGAGDLAAHLASAFTVPDDRPVDLARVSQYVATMQGSGPLYDELHARFEAAVEPGPLHRFLARLPALLRERGAPHQLIVTTNYDLALERAFEEAGEELDIVAYVATGHASRPLLAPPAGRAAPTDRRPEHLRDRARPRAAHDPAEAARRRRPAPRARVGELRHHRGRLHRLPRPLGADRGRARRARREAAPEPLPLPRLRDGRLEPAAHPQPDLGRAARRRTARGRCSARRARSRRRSGGGSTSRALDVEPQSYVELLERRLEAA